MDEQQTETVTDSQPSSTGAAPLMALMIEKGKKRKKKNRKDSLMLRGPGKLLLAYTEAMLEMGQALTSAAKRYKRKHKKSKEKKRDGWLKDLGSNWSSAFSKFVNESSDAPKHFFKTLTRKDKKRSKRKKDKVRTVLLQPINSSQTEAAPPPAE